MKVLPGASHAGPPRRGAVRAAVSGAALWAALCAAPAFALVERLDDSSSPRAQVSASLDQGPAALLPGAPVSPIVRVPFGRVEYRLATARHVGRQARIYYVIPAAVGGLRSPAGLQVHWRGSGLFSAGQGRPGDRVPVWSGLVREAWMQESLDLNWEVDLRELHLMRGMPLGFEAYFEIETSP